MSFLRFGFCLALLGSTISLGAAYASKIAVSISGGRDYVQFDTKLSRFRNVEDSLLVRPSYPDREQFIELKNTSTETVAIKDLKIWIPNVTADVTLTESSDDDLALAPEESLRINLVYAPNLPTNKDATTQHFSTKSGLLIFTDDADDPLIPIELRGRSTFNSDVNYDGVVNFSDLGVLNSCFPKDSTDPSFDPTADINGDGFCNFNDLGGLNNEFLRTLPALEERTVRVAAVSTSSGYPEVVTKIDALLNDQPNLDLVLTPEYSFFSLGPINMNCARTCDLESIGTSDSDLLLSVIEGLKEKAKQSQVNIVLGTVIAGVLFEGNYIYDNTALLISNQGEIIAHHRKGEFPFLYAPSVCKVDSPDFSASECERLHGPSKESGYPVALSTKSGEMFTLFSLICAELESAPLMERMRGTQVDLLAHALSSGDILTDTMAGCVQDQKDMTTFPCSLASDQIKRLYFDQWKDSFGILRNNGGVLSSDLAGGKVGAFNTSLSVIPTYDLRTDYLYTELKFPAE